jgi:hypothetical protein
VSSRTIAWKCAKCLVAAGVLLLGILISVPVGAQVAGGALSGTISDPSGAGIPQARIVIRNVATGVERTVTTNTDGFYTAPNLLPGEYQVTLEAKGFNTETRTGITMTVGAQRTFDLALQIGTVEHRVEVTT